MQGSQESSLLGSLTRLRGVGKGIPCCLRPLHGSRAGHVAERKHAFVVHLRVRTTLTRAHEGSVVHSKAIREA